MEETQETPAEEVTEAPEESTEAVEVPVESPPDLEPGVPQEGNVAANEEGYVTPEAPVEPEGAEV